MTTAIDFGFTFDVPVRIDWDSIERARIALRTCLATLFESAEHCEMLAMIAGELLENAVKYARATDDSGVFRLSVWGTMGGETHIRVANRADPGSAEVVLETVACIQAAPSTTELLRRRVRELAASPRPASRLGLLRIAHESKCRLDAKLSQEILTVTATVPSGAAKGAEAR